MQELSAMTVQLAASLESMTHTRRIIYISVGGHDFHLKGIREHCSLALLCV